MDDKKFIYTVMSIFVPLTILIMSFNYWIDPLWHYNHSHAYNDVQIVADEREQKTANQFFVPKHQNTLLIGSSRSTYIQPSGFKKWEVYNYSVANLSMREYHTMLLYALEQNPNFDKVLLGIDFFKSSVQEAEDARAISGYAKKVQEPFYRTKSLLSLDALDYSIDNFILSAKNEISRDRLYNREGDAFAKKLSKQETLKETAYKVYRFEKSFYGSNYQYYPQYKEIMEKVHDTYPEVEKIVYTTPISTELFISLVSTGLLDEYEKWIRDLVDVYGGVWNFMYPNSITNNSMNYYDGHHFYPEIGELISARLEGRTLENLPEDFGEFITPENLEEHLEKVRTIANTLK